ncbi:MAG: hypothetical protein FWG77_10560, partial [Treponema sp.]|nr:hypothetical protein [Treponema sp.]
MERIRSVFIILMALCALLLLGSCDGFYTEDEQGETGSFTIDLWGTGRSVAFPPEDILPLGSGDPDGPSLAELKFEVIFTELESSTERSFTFMGNEDSRGTIAVGTYFVKMEVRFLNDNHYAWGIPEDNPITIT